MRCPSPPRLRLEALDRRDVPAIVNWTLNADGDFATPGAWTDPNGTHRVPGPGDLANVPEPFVVTSSADQTVDAIAAARFRLLGGTFAVNAVNDFSTLRQLTVAAGASLRARGGGNAQVTIVGAEVAGNLHAEPGGTVRLLRDSINLNAGTTLTGTGQFLIEGDVFGGPNVALNTPLTAPAELVLRTGVLTGPADFTVPPGVTFQWVTPAGQTSAMSGTGTTLVQPGGSVVVGGPGAKSLDGRTMRNAGTVTFQDAGPWNLQGAAVLDNLAGATVSIQTDAAIGGAPSGADVPRIVNAGTLTKSSPAGTGTGIVGAALFSTGTVVVQSGTLNVYHPFGVGSVAGPVQLSGGNLSFGSLGGFLNGEHALDAGASVSGPGALVLEDGTLRVNAAVPVERFRLSNGTLRGLGTLTVTGAGTWAAGMMSDAGTTAIAAGATLTLTGTAEKTLFGRRLVNAGTVQHAELGPLKLQNNAVVDNRAGGVYNLAADANFSNAFGQGDATCRVENAGLFVKSSPAGGESLIAYDFRNTGTAHVDSGTLRFALGYTQTAGTTLVAAGATLKPDPAFTGNATVQLTGGTLAGNGTAVGNVQGAGTVSPGASPGLLTVNGNVNLGGPFAVELNGVTAGSQYDQLAVNGTVTLGGPLNLSVGFAAPAGAQFRVIDNDGADAVTGTFAGLAEGATVTANGQAFTVSYVGGTGNDVVLTRGGAPAAPPRVAGVTVNAGQPNAMQRSRVTSLALRFDSPVTFANGDVAAAFGLSRVGGGAVGGFAATAAMENGVTVVTLTGFTGNETQFGSLADGRYSILVRANLVSAGGQQLDGNGDGAGGDDYALNGTTANGLFRLFGDVDGSGVVNAFDFGQFRGAFGSSTGQSAYLEFLDINNDGSINAFDFGQFRNRFGSGVP